MVESDVGTLAQGGQDSWKGQVKINMWLHRFVFENRPYINYYYYTYIQDLFQTQNSAATWKIDRAINVELNLSVGTSIATKFQEMK